MHRRHWLPEEYLVWRRECSRRGQPVESAKTQGTTACPGGLPPELAVLRQLPLCCWPALLELRNEARRGLHNEWLVSERDLAYLKFVRWLAQREGRTAVRKP